MKIKYIISVMLLVFAIGFVFSLQIAKTNDTPNNTDNITIDLQNESLNLSQNESLDGLANPASVYCYELGYSHKIIETPEGQVGICMFPDGAECDEWEFYAGTCGQTYNYCAQNGYETIIKRDGLDGYYPVYSVCIRKKKIIGPVSALMNLPEKLLPGCQTDLDDSTLNIAGASEKSIPKTIGKGVVK